MDNAYLGLVSVFDTEKPKEYGYGKVHCRLAISSDLKTWKWIESSGLTGSDFIPLGGQSTTASSNAFDSHICFAAASPLQMEDGSARIYYMGGNGPHNGERNSSLALATLPSWNHFAGISGSSYNVTTVRLLVTGKKLFITMDVESEAGGFVQIGTNEDNTLSPSMCKKIFKSGVDMEVIYNGGNDFTKWIGKEIVLNLIMETAMVYTVGFE